MGALLIVEQILNGIQLGVTLFLMAAGLTLIFGIMNMINLAHGSLFTIGAYLLVTFQKLTGSFVLGLALAVPAAALFGVLLEVVLVRKLYTRDHLDQSLATIGLILLFNEGVRFLWGKFPLGVTLPDVLAGSVEIVPGSAYPAFRLLVIAIGIAVAVGLWLLVAKTRIGMLVRAGASDREMTQMLGINVKRLYTIVFALGTALAGLAGAMAAPIVGVQSGMGDGVLILTLVVIVIGGTGSIRGAFIAALVVGLFDTFGRVLLPAAVASMAIYLLMAAVLVWRPEGLFGVRA